MKTVTYFPEEHRTTIKKLYMIYVFLKSVLHFKIAIT